MSYSLHDPNQRKWGWGGWGGTAGVHTAQRVCLAEQRKAYIICDVIDKDSSCSISVIEWSQTFKLWRHNIKQIYEVNVALCHTLLSLLRIFKCKEKCAVRQLLI